MKEKKKTKDEERNCYLSYSRNCITLHRCFIIFVFFSLLPGNQLAGIFFVPMTQPVRSIAELILKVNRVTVSRTFSLPLPEPLDSHSACNFHGC